MHRTITATLLATAVLAIPAAANAKDGVSMGWKLVAKVEPYCRVQSEIGDGPAIFADGAVNLGAVREVCNTRGGYNLNVQVVNVVSGRLQHGSESQMLDTDGRAWIVSPMARSRTHQWRLTEAVLAQPTAPVYLRVSISPL